MTGAFVAEVYVPGACNTDNGVTQIKSDFLTITFLKDNESFTCWGKGIERFTSGF
jgi:hypothetical protein